MKPARPRPRSRPAPHPQPKLRTSGAPARRPLPVLDDLGVAAVVLDARGRIALWSPQAEQLFGYAAPEVLGRSVLRLLAAESDAAEVRRLFEVVMQGAGHWEGGFPVRRKDGGSTLVEVRAMRLHDALGRPYALGLVSDRAAAVRLERDLALSGRLVSQTPVGLAVMDTELRCVAVNPALAAVSGAPAARFVGRSGADALPFLDRAEFLAAAAEVLATGQPVLDRTGTAPARSDGRQARAWSVSFYRLDDAQGTVLGLAASAVEVTDRHREHQELERGRRRLALVADASLHIGTTLDLARTAEELAQLCVPEVADIAAVDVIDALLPGHRRSESTTGGTCFRALAVAADHPGPATEAADPPGEAAEYGEDRLVTRCARTGRPVHLRTVGPGDLDRIARSSEASALLAEAGVHSYLAVPLIARGEVLGVLDLKRAGNPDPIEEDDVLLAIELAARAAVAIDNARWYQRARNTAATLQRGLLPSPGATRPGLEIAYRYQPADQADEVGGDWFDVIALPGGRTGLAVGDVMGSGIEAATTMGRLRTAGYTLAGLGLPPARLLHHLDRIAEEIGPQIATSLFGIFDPATGELRMADAGHPPPVLLGPGRSPELLAVEPGVPLGVGGGVYRTLTARLLPGETLVLYTDGLVENRAEHIDEGLASLLELSAGLAEVPLPELCDRLMGRLRHRRHSDDVTVLAARAVGPAG
ncbi:SpoIIE family protein phosphatase [Kitasatospora sp. NPDC094015]|uniref:SpoIIE family protein phosphatase n=1 Tax=Kitasatospora sp. NPDC094015 TaxID=3155205 RepID=UPI00332A15B8